MERSCPRRTATSRHRRHSPRKGRPKRYRFQVGKRYFVTWQKSHARRRYDRPSNAGRHDRSSLLLARGLVDFEPLSGFIGRREGLALLRHDRFTRLASSRSHDVVETALRRRFAGLVYFVCTAHNVDLQSIWNSRRRDLFVGSPGAFCCQHRADPQLVPRMHNEFADHPRLPNREVVLCAYDSRPATSGRSGKVRSSHDSDAFGLTYRHQGEGAGRGTVDGRYYPPRTSRVRRTDVAAGPDQDQAARSSSVANIARLSSRWLYRQTYSFRYPCNHLGETA